MEEKRELLKALVCNNGMWTWCVKCAEEEVINVIELVFIQLFIALVSIVLPF